MSRNGSGTYSLYPGVNPVVTGTTITSAWANNTLNDLATAMTASIANDGQTPILANLIMSNYRHTGVGNAVARTDYAAAGQIQDNSLAFGGTAGGTADVLTITLSPVLTAYVTGQRFLFVSGASPNATTTPTLNVNGVGAKTFLRRDGTAIVAGDITASTVFEAVYNGTNMLLNSYILGTVPATSGGTGQTSYTIGDLLYASSSTALSKLAAGTSGFVLTSGGAGVAPAWAATTGITATTSITSSATLTSSSNGYQYIAMSAAYQAVTLPDATTMSIGSPKFYLDNTAGTYPCGIKNSAGTLIGVMDPGGSATVSLQNISSAAGVWGITGVNLAPGWIVADTTFSSTYAATTIFSHFVALDSNKSLHFLKIASNGLAVYAIDKSTNAVGTPVTITTTASTIVKSCFMITSTTAVVFYGEDTANLRAVVVSLSGATTLSVGTASGFSATGCAVEDFYGAPKVAQLDTTLYLVSYATATGAGTTSVVALQISAGTTVTWGSAVNIISSNNCINSTQTYKITTLTGFVLYKSGAAAPYANSGVVVSVTNANPPVCTVGTPAALTNVGSSLVGAAMSCQLSSTKYLVADDNNTAGSFIASAFTVSAGTTVTAGTLVSVETGATTSSIYITNSASRYNPHLSPLTATTALMWYFDNNGVSRVVVLSESSGTVTKGTIVYGSVSNASPQTGFMQPQGTTEFTAVRQASSGPVGVFLAPHKIASTTITMGSCYGADFVNAISSANSLYARLSSGTYIFQGSTADATTYKHPVFTSNGDYIKFKGNVWVPNLSLTSAPLPITVSSSRIVCTGSTSLCGNTVAVATEQVRTYSIEAVAA